MKEVIMYFVLQAFGVLGKPSISRYSIADPTEVRRAVKRAANLNSGVSLTAFQEDQLNLHNHYRKLHGVPLMSTDNKLNSEAQLYAELLAKKDLFEHCTSNDCNPSSAGENLAYAGGHTLVEINATLRWYEEVKDYNYCSFPQGRATTRPGHEGKIVGHFTQVVWRTSNKLGIGYSRNRDRTKVYVVARYSPPGNYIGQFSANVPKASYLLKKFQDICNGANGGLTEWSQPGVCTKTCGRGVRFQYRTCTNPMPALNGKDCVGETKRVVRYWCNAQACASPVNERDDQCRERGWQPKSRNFGGSNECILHCLDPSRAHFYFARGNVDDGTHCQNSNGACVAGSCIVF